MIRTMELTRSFGATRAVDSLSVEVPAGQIVGLLGANGAGKTTTIHMLVTLLEPSSGTAEVAGHDILTDPLAVRRALGYVPEHGAVYEGLTADEYIEMAGKVRGLDQATIEGRAHRILSHFDLHDARSPRAGPSCDDPSTLGGLAAGMLVALGYVGFFLIEPTLLESLPSPSGKVPTRSAFTFFLGALMLPLITLPSLVYSSDARAIWSLAAANLEPRRVVRAQRGVARATSLLPLTAALLLVHAKAGTGLLVAVADAALIWLVWELVGGAVQLLYPVMPFSRPREGRGEELLPFFLLIMPTFVMLAVWTAGVYDLVTFSLGKVITLAALAGGLLRLHRKIDEGIAVRGLPVELAPRVNRAA